METHVESAPNGPESAETGIRIRMLGPLTLSRNGQDLALPASRKVRALLGYLAMAPHPVGRSQLCELLWDLPSDPRGELRWTLSKLRALLDEPGRRRVATGDDAIGLDLAACDVDALAVERRVRDGLDQLDPAALRMLAGRFAGEFLEGLGIDRSPHFQSWLVAQRRHFRACRVAVLERLVATLPAGSDEALPHLEALVALTPFDGRAHAALLAALAGRGRVDDCEAHLATAARLFEAEGVPFGPVREAWRGLKEQHARFTRPAAPTVPDRGPDPPAAADPGSEAHAAGRRASLAVMPFGEGSGREVSRGGLSDGLTQDIITRLARLRSLFVIARGSVFALAEQGVGAEDAARRLGVDYVVSGEVQRRSGRIVATVELIEVRSSRLVWTEVFDHRTDGALLVLDEIGDRIVSSIAHEVETVERNRALLRPPSSLDAWGAYHRGLWHMYRFTRPENEAARHFFETAIRLDPTFSRAHAGLSFTHWQNAFQHWADRRAETELAYAAAAQSLIVDEHDPAAHWAMGRAMWLLDRQGEALGELERAVDLSPNFALGHYALSFVQSQTGDPAAAIRASDYSRRLSPFDPLLFGMLGTRAMAHIRLGQFEEAADWALKAAARPNAHGAITALAAHCLVMAGRIEEARGFAATLRRAMPQYGVADLLNTFRFTPDTEALFRKAAVPIGLA